MPSPPGVDSEVFDEVVHTVVKTVIQIINIPAFQKGKIVEVKYKTIGNEQKFEVVDAYVP